MSTYRTEITLGVNVDTKQAKQQLKELQGTLTKLSTNEGNINLADDLKTAQAEASKLKAILSSSTTSMGTLDLSQLQKAMKESGMNVEQLRSKLTAMGPAGQQAFAQMATAVQNANPAFVKTNKLIDNMWTSLKNAAKWQISSSVIHGFMSAIQSAVGYAQDLNKNLTDIRIVSEATSAQMDQFAIKATKMAKELSTTTNQYVKASLIYFQQGLNEQEVEKRANATTKMANVTGQAVQTVSDQMTAIWNNFNNGTKSLEYYADVITALGAATASSTDEIAAGLEKFIAVGETIGLSYEYATAALATVTDKTRQSADTVGTAFKTLFSRIQGLSLGKTLDDGTTLNKYSEALSKVGVSIKDSNGNLKNMDDILNEMGNKWKTLSKDQQVALAQTVGGIRQYNQLMSLMNNWDTFKVNLDVAFDAEGTLDRQQKIYEDSWEGASNRVRASLEGIFNKIVDDKAFINMLNGLSQVLDKVQSIIDAFGGLQGVLITLGGTFTALFSQKIGAGIGQLATGAVNTYSTIKNYGIGSMFSSKKRNEALQKEFSEGLKNNLGKKDATLGGNLELSVYAQQGKYEQKFLENKNFMSPFQQTYYQSLLKAQAEGMENILASAEKEKKSERQVEDLTQYYQKRIEDTPKLSDYSINHRKEALEDFRKKTFSSQILSRKNEQVGQAHSNLLKGLDSQDVSKVSDSLEQLQQEMTSTQQMADRMGMALGDMIGDEAAAAIDKVLAKIQTLKAQIANLDDGENINTSDFDDLNAELENFDMINTQSQEAAEKAKGEVDSGKHAFMKKEQSEEYKNAVQKNADDVYDSNKDYEEKVENVGKEMDKLNKAGEGMKKFEASVEGVTAGLGALAAGWQGVAALMDVWDPSNTASGIDKITSSVGILIGVLPGVISGITGMITAIQTAGGPWVIGITLALTAIIALITAISSAISNHTISLDAEIENVQNTLQSLEEEYQSVTQEAEKFKQAISDYSAGISTLNGLTQGTEEYKQVLEETNEKARELIETYELFGDWEYNDKGQIIIGKEAFEKKQKTYQSREENLDRQIENSKMNIASMQIEKRANSVIDKLELWVSEDQKKRTIMSGIVDIEELNNLIGEIKDFSILEPDKLKEAIEQTFTFAQWTKDLQLSNLNDPVSAQSHLLDNIVNNYREDIIRYIKEKEEFDNEMDYFISNQVKDQINTGSELADAAVSSLITNYAKEQEENSSKFVLTDAAAKELTGDGKLYFKEIRDSILGGDNSVIDEKEEDIGGLKSKQLQTFLEDKGVVMDKNNTDWAIMAHAMLRMGYKDINEATENITYTDKKGYITYYDKNTGEKIDLLNDTEKGTDYKKVFHDLLQETIQGANDKEFEDLIEKQGKEFQEIAKSIQQGTANVSKEIGGDVSTGILTALANKRDLLWSDISSEFSKEEFEKFEGKSGKDLAEYFGLEGLTEEQVKKSGFESLDAFYNWIEAAVDAGSNAFDQLGKSVLENVKGLYESFEEIDKLTYKEAEAYKNSLNKAYVEGGKEGAQAYDNFIKNLSFEDQKAFLNAFDSIDWNSGYTNFANILTAAGFNLDKITGELFMMLADIFSSYETNLNKYLSQTNAINKLDIGEGDTIDPEIFTTLGPMAASYFQTMEDGTYKLIASAAEFKRVATKEITQKYLDNLPNSQKDITALKEGIGAQTFNVIDKKGEIVGEKLFARDAYIEGQRIEGATYELATGTALNKSFYNQYLPSLEQLITHTGNSQNFLLDELHSFRNAFGDDGNLGAFDQMRFNDFFERVTEATGGWSEVVKILPKLPAEMAQVLAESVTTYSGANQVYLDKRIDSDQKLEMYRRLDNDPETQRQYDEIKAQGLSAAGLNHVETPWERRRRLEENEKYVDNYRVEAEERYQAAINYSKLAGNELIKERKNLESLDQNTVMQYRDSIRQQYEKEGKSTENVNFDELTEENLSVNLRARTEEFEETLNSILERKYELELSIVADATAAVDEVQAAVEDVNGALSILKDGNLLSVDEFQQVISVFPELAAAAENAGNGMIAIDQQAIASANDTAKARINALIDEQIAKNELRIQELEQEKALNTAIITMLQTGEATKAQVLNAIDAARTAAIEHENTRRQTSDQETQASIRTEAEITQGAVDTAVQDAAVNFGTAMENMQGNASRAAEGMIASMEAVANAISAAANGDVAGVEAAKKALKENGIKKSETYEIKDTNDQTKWAQDNSGNTEIKSAAQVFYDELKEQLAGMDDMDKIPKEVSDAMINSLQGANKEIDDKIALYEGGIAAYEATRDRYGKTTDGGGGGGGGSKSDKEKEKDKYHGLDEKDVKNYTKALKEQNKALADNEEAAEALAIAHMRVNRGMETLSQNWDNWSEILTNGTLMEQAEIMDEVEAAMQDILTMDTEEYQFLPSDFVQKNMELIAQVKDGNLQALEQLRAEAGKEILIKITGSTQLDSELQDIHNKLIAYQASMPELSADATINDAGFIAMCEALIAKAGMTAAQIQAYFASLGYDIKLTTNSDGSIKVESVSLGGSQGMTAPSAPSSGGGGGGGGGGESNKPQYEDKRYAKDYIERYYELDKAINQAKQSLESMNKEMDLAWGADRITALQNANKQIKNNINLLKQKDEAVLKNYEQDKKEVTDMGFTYDDKTETITNYEEQMTARFDSWTPDMIDPEKVLVSGTEETVPGGRNMAAIVAGTFSRGDKNGGITVAGSPVTGNEKKGNELTQDTLMNRTVEKIQQADETYELHTSILQEISDAEIEILTNNAKILSSIYEMQQEILDKSYELVDIAMEGLDFDNIYSGIESLVNFMSNNTSPFGKLNDNLKLNAEGILTNLEAVEKARAENKISESAYIEGLSTNFSEAANLREQILDFQNTFLEVLENISSISDEMINEQMAKYERFTSAMEHYSNTLGLMGREDAQELSNVIMKSYQNTILSNLKANKAYYESLEKDRVYYQKMYETTTDTELKEMYRQRLEETEGLMSEVKNVVQSQTEALFENTQRILTNNLILAKKKIDDIMAGDDYKTLESLTKHIDQQYELQDMYLTKTNQLYETNKMIRAASLKIDQTDNEVTKKKYQDYIKYVKQLGNASKLSQIELSAAQKRFDILEAQIALEEAQNAKNNVRLSRDSEGNWGYVYTADQNNIAEAEQRVADAENALYNESIDNFKTYQQQRAQISAELINDLEALNEKRRSGELSEEDYKAEVKRTKQFYYKKYENLVSFQEMSYNTYKEMGVAEDNLFEETLMSLDEFKDNTENYLDEVTGVFDQWKEDNKEIATEVGGIYAELADSMGQPIEEVINKINGPDGSLTKALKEVGDSTDELTKKLIGGDGEIGLIQEMENARKAAQEAILGNTGYYEEAKGLIDGIMGVMEKIEEILKPYYAALQAKYGEEDLLADPQKEGKDEGEETTSEGNDSGSDTTPTKPAGTLGSEKKSDAPSSEYKHVDEDKIPNTYFYYENIPENEKLQGISENDIDTNQFTANQAKQYQMLDAGQGLDLETVYGGKENIPEASNDIISWLHRTFLNVLSSANLYMTAMHGKGVDYMGTTYHKGEDLALAIMRDYQILPEWVDSIKDFNKFLVHLMSNIDEAKDIYHWDINRKFMGFDKESEEESQHMKDIQVWGGETDEEKLAVQYYKGIEQDLLELTRGQGYGWLQRSKEYLALTRGPVFYGLESLWRTPISEFDTGGYTGEWGPDGRFATVHEKEIILNKYDTENFLQAIEMVRSIADFIDKNASISALGLLDYGKIETPSSTDKTVQQEVRIQADFPNVQDHNEIELAMENLINIASQYANRKI